MKITINEKAAERLLVRLGESFVVDAIEVEGGTWSFFFRKHPGDTCPVRLEASDVQILDSRCPSCWRLNQRGECWVLGPVEWTEGPDLFERLYEGDQDAVDAYCAMTQRLDFEDSEPTQT